MEGIITVLDECLLILNDTSLSEDERMTMIVRKLDSSFVRFADIAEIWNAPFIEWEGRMKHLKAIVQHHLSHIERRKKNYGNSEQTSCYKPTGCF